MAVFSNLQIRQAIEDGRIICHPYLPEHISYASLDCSLGYYFYRYNNGQHVGSVFSESGTLSQFQGPFKAAPYIEIKERTGQMAEPSIEPTHPVILIAPGERILTHSHEFIGILPPGAAELKPRSSWSRAGLTISPGWIQPGYINRLALILHNTSSQNMFLPVGERLAQVVFYETGEIDKAYGSTRDLAADKYQIGNDLETVIKTWTPDMLLPKIYMDQRKLPAKVEGSPYE